MPPRFSYYTRDNINHNGAFSPEYGIFVRSGSISDVSGSITGSADMVFDAIALRLRRVEVFHSGAATSFDIRLERSIPNTGSFYDPRDTVVCYDSVIGSTDYSGGVDQVEDLFCLTNSDETTNGQLRLKVMPYGAGNNSFKYLLFFEAVMLYADDNMNINI